MVDSKDFRQSDVCYTLRDRKLGLAETTKSRTGLVVSRGRSGARKTFVKKAAARCVVPPRRLASDEPQDAMDAGRYLSGVSFGGLSSVARLHAVL